MENNEGTQPGFPQPALENARSTADPNHAGQPDTRDSLSVVTITSVERKALIVGDPGSLLGVIGSLLPWEKVTYIDGFIITDLSLFGDFSEHHPASFISLTCFILGIFLLTARTISARKPRWAGYAAFGCGGVSFASCLFALIQIMLESRYSSGFQFGASVWLIVTMMGSITLIVGSLLPQKGPSQR